METPETIAPVPAVEARSVMPKLAAAGDPPWRQDRPESRAFAAPIAVRLERTGETVHWSVVALTLFTAMGVLIGAYGRNTPEPRELLPIVIYAR